MSEHPKASIVYCPKCGHSADRERLSIGSEECDSRLVWISGEEWKRLAPGLTLTEAGRRALQQEDGNGE